MPDMQEEAFALLLAIVGDIDPGLGLFVDNPAQGFFAEALEFGRIDQFAAGAANVQPGQLGRPRQAAGMGGQDPLFAAAHGRLSPRF